MSKLLPPTMNGNIIMLNFETHSLMCEFIFKHELGIEQYSVKKLEDSTWLLSAPVTATLEDLIPGILHGARARAKPLEKPAPKPPTGGGDGTPPSGGTPGTPVLDTYTHTEARAA